jgi:alpha-ribazole phosphatase/probable phosphoglycerate mutase
MTDSPETVVDLLRHGEPLGGSRYRGQVDDPLSERGWQQMWQAVDKASGWQRIVSSPLLRCREFALQLGERLDVPVRAEARFREIGFGEWEGKTRAELERLQPGQVQRFYQDPVAHRPMGAEPLDAFMARVGEAFTELLARYAGEAVLVVAHAGVIRAILANALDIPPASMYRIHVPNAGISQLRTDRIRGINLVSHGK